MDPAPSGPPALSMPPPPDGPPARRKGSTGRDVGLGLALGVAWVVLTFWCLTTGVSLGQDHYSYNGTTSVVTHPSPLRLVASNILSFLPLASLIAVHVVALAKRRPQVITGFWLLLAIGVLILFVSCFALLAGFGR